MELTGKQRRHLRALGHHLDAVVQVGKEGVTPALIEAVARALADHELIKLRIGQNAGLDRHQLAGELAARTGSAVAQVLGATILLYRPDPEEPRIELPLTAGVRLVSGRRPGLVPRRKSGRRSAV